MSPPQRLPTSLLTPPPPQSENPKAHKLALAGQMVRTPIVVVLDDDFNTFQHVVETLVRIIPGMLADKAWDLAHRIDGEGSAVVWCGPQEQAELYHQQLGAAGLTMAPLERA